MEVIEGTVNLSFVPISSPPPHHHQYCIFFDKVGYRPGSLKADVDLRKDLHTQTHLSFKVDHTIGFYVPYSLRTGSLTSHYNRNRLKVLLGRA